MTCSYKLELTELTLNSLSQQLELKNVNLRAGDELKVKGVVLHDAER